MNKILMTGHLGLVGRHLSPLLYQLGYEVVGFDIADGTGDICNTGQLSQALNECCGVIHLAAVSRVVWAQNDPEKCWQTNALASEQLLKLAANSTHKPWVLVASSREVYMEDAALSARSAGINTAIVRLANVYGCTLDHEDRVLPAFSKNAALGVDLRVDGFEHLFDFTHLDDTVAGLVKAITLLSEGEKQLPPIHLLPGHGTTLKQAAQMAIKAANSSSTIVEAASRAYDVARFIGDPSRAKSLLGWQASVLPEQGIARLVDAYNKKLKLGAHS